MEAEFPVERKSEKRDKQVISKGGELRRRKGNNGLDWILHAPFSRSNITVCYCTKLVEMCGLAISERKDAFCAIQVLSRIITMTFLQLQDERETLSNSWEDDFT